MDAPPLTIRDRLINAARDGDDLVAKAKLHDPTLYEQLAGKAALYSKGVWGPLVALAVTAVLAHYGLSVSPETQGLFVGGIVAVASILIRVIWTKGPITAVMSAPDTIPAPKP